MINRIVRNANILSVENSKDILEKLNYYREYSSKGLHKLNNSELAELNSDFKFFFNLNISFFADTYPSPIYRITNNKKLYHGQKVKLQKVTDLIGPPEGLSKLGRCNLQGESIFYAALDVNTAIWETQPQAGDYITLSEWKIKDGQQLNTHAIFHPEVTNINQDSQNVYLNYINSKKKIDVDLSDSFHEILKFFSEEFMKPIKEPGNINYLFSAIISSRLLQSEPDSNGFRIDAIMYPSIKRGYGISNFAILNSLVFSKLDLVSITVIDVQETNYDEQNKTRNDLLKVSPLQVRITEFDYENNKIIYNAEEELRMAVELAKKYGRRSFL